MLVQFKTGLLCLGVLLLALNTVGMFGSLRTPGLEREPTPLVESGGMLSEKELLEIAASDATDKQAYAVRMTHAVHAGMRHYWEDAGIRKYNLRVPATENYLLYLAGLIMPRHFAKYEFVDSGKAIERGVGMCAQQACVLSDLLEKKQISTRVVGLSGHVVTMARVGPAGDTWWVLDPDYGVVVKHSIGDIERNPELIRNDYESSGYNKKTVDMLVDIYGKSGNTVYLGSRDYCGPRWWIERIAYGLKWPLPVLLILAASWSWIFRSRRKDAELQERSEAA